MTILTFWLQKSQAEKNVSITDSEVRAPRNCQGHFLEIRKVKLRKVIDVPSVPLNQYQCYAEKPDFSPGCPSPTLTPAPGFRRQEQNCCSSLGWKSVCSGSFVCSLAALNTAALQVWGCRALHLDSNWEGSSPLSLFNLTL